MASTYTSRNRLNKQGTGDNANTWGDILNSGVFDLTDDSLDGVASVNVTGSVTVDLTTSVANGSTDLARMRVLKFLGIPTPAQTSVTLPALEKWYWVYTSLQTTSNVVLHAAGSSVEVTVGQNDVQAVWCDGTDLFNMTTGVDESLFFLVANRFSEISADASAQGVARDNLGLEGGATTSVYVCVGGLVQFTSVSGSTAYPAADGSLITNVSATNFRAATTVTAGIIEIATTAETTVGTDHERAVTPSTLKKYVDDKVGIQLLNTFDATAGVSVIDFTSYISSTYSSYLITYDRLAHQSGASGHLVQLQFRNAGGWHTGTTDYNYAIQSWAATITTSVDNGAGIPFVTQSTSVATALTGATGRINIDHFFLTPGVNSETVNYDGSVTNSFYSAKGAPRPGNSLAPGPYTGCRIQCSSLMDYANVKIYGII